MVASDEGSQASDARVTGFAAAFEGSGGGGARLGQIFASLDSSEELFILGPEEDVGRRVALSLANWASIPGSIAQ